ncbi:phosphodiester glycosidase family protein [Anaerosalibacter sp. Marseille-P3206]|uniref:phosphodiester glycosidase family protein n=1 Tax=Anaerosalibacter sp. Marseille-P3206 TaxID=1871005 RepID=UPI0009873EB9|nr:phosphodiester glycosidase family protein [Anaerosalibacter sp. Marseille-P3206]
MNKFIKKFAVSLLALSIILSSNLLPFAKASNAQSLPFVIYENKDSEHLSSGVVHEHVQRFTAKGWWNINVLRVDLQDEYTEVKGLFSNKGISKREKVSTMVNESNAIAGVNGDFFNYKPFASPIGTLINDGEIISSPMERQYAKPAFVLDNNKNVQIAYFDKKLAAVSSATGKEVILSAINKASQAYAEVMLYNKHWGAQSIGNKLHNDLIEIVVIDDVVTEVRIGQPPIAIPENGYVLVGRERVKDRLLDNFHVGDTVQLNLTTTPNLENIKMAIGGGSIILKDGVPMNSHNIAPGLAPRTGMGVSQDGKELIIATIDGRDTSYKGVNEKTFGSILKELGSYNAIMFDGGGSTAMAVKYVDESQAKLVNRPSDGGERKVINGVGLFSNAPKGELASIKISTDDKFMFANTTRRFKIKGYDQYHNPIEVDQNNAVFTVEGVNGEINGNTLKALSPGKAKVRANYNGITADIDMVVLDKVADIVTETERFTVDINSQKNLGVFYAKDKDGFQALVYPEDVKWEVTGNIGHVQDGIFYSGNTITSGAITARIGTGVENILVAVGSKGTKVDSLDDISRFSFSSYPKEVTGSIYPAIEAKEGNGAIALKYDFTSGEGTRACYVNLRPNGEQGLSIEGNPSKLGLWVYGDEGTGWLRGNITDSKGQSYYIDFAKNIDWTGWKHVVADIPSNVSYPIKLDRIYLTEIDSVKKYTGEIYLDELVAQYPVKFENVQLPTASVMKDERNVNVAKNKNGFSFAVTSAPQNLDEVVGYKASDKILANVNKHNVAIYLGGSSNEFKNASKAKANIDIVKGYKPYRYNNNLLIIKADDSKNGLRASNPEQWLWLKNDLENSKEKNIVLVLPKPIFGSGGFTDKLEANLLHEILSETKLNGKDIWVVHGGNENSANLKDGIRYIQVNSKGITNPEDIYNLSIAEFTVNGDNITYQIKTIFQKPQIQ